MNKFLLLIIALLIISFGYAQCIETVKYPDANVTSTNDGFVQTIANNNYAGEYAVIVNIISGHNYEFTSTPTSSSNMDFITIRDEFGALITSGNSPLEVVLNATTVQMHISLDSSCSNESEFRVTTIQNLTNAPTCYNPEVPIGEITYKSNNRVDFSWSAPNEGPTPIEYDWEIVPQGNDQGVDVVAFGSTTLNEASSGETLTPNTNYSIWLRSVCGENDESIWVNPSIFNFKTNLNAPPDNDFCSGAITIIQETEITSANNALNPIAGTLAGGAGTDVDAETCNATNGNARDDVWFSFLAQTNTVNITLEPLNFDMVLTLYAGTCNNLIYEDCSDAEITSPATEEINATGLMIGQIYYIRAYYYGELTPSNPTFTLKLWSTESIVDSDNDGYSDDYDCVDDDDTIYPGATEIPDNGIDEDCDGADLQTWYLDSDGDGFGDSSNSILANTQPTDYVSNNTDCDDSDEDEFPGQTWYEDVDADGYGSGATQTACERPINYYLASELTATSGDCNDTVGAINPAATEVCDGVDNNCVGGIDEGVQTTYYADTDGDGYGDSSDSIQACSAPADYVENNDDCDDTNEDINPGIIEICNGLDDNCDGVVDEGFDDADSDGVADCIDNCPTISNPDQEDSDSDGTGDACESLSNEMSILDNLVINPNPFYDSIEIHLPNEFNNILLNMSLLDIRGRIVVEQKNRTGNGLLRLQNLDKLNDGIYILKVELNKAYYYKKMLKK